MTRFTLSKLPLRKFLLGLIALCLLPCLFAGRAGAQTQIADFTSIANCGLVLDANQPSYTTPSKAAYSVNEGDAVGCWADQSGGGHDALQATVANQPTLHLNALGNPLTGYQSRTIRFGGGTAGLLTNLSVTSGSFTVVAVYAQTAAGVPARVVNGSNNWLIGPYASNYGYSAYSGSAFTPATASLQTGPYIIQTVTQSPTTLTSQVYGTAAIGTTPTVNYPGTIGLGTPANSDVAFVVIYTRLLSASEIAQVQDLIGRRLGYLSHQVAFCGNSLTYGTNNQGLSPSSTNYASRALALLGTKVSLTKTVQAGSPGYTSSNLNNVTANVNIDYNIWPTLSATGKRIVVVWEITNDIAASSTPSATSVYNNIVALSQHFKSAGDTVILLDCLPRGPFNAAQETCRQSVNASLAADFSASPPAYADYLVKVSADSNLSTVNANYGTDAVHLNGTGYQYVAADVVAVLQPLVSPAGGTKRKTQ